MKLEYAHLPLNEEVRGLSGFYIPSKEVRLKYNGKEVLYVIGISTLDSSCCGVSSVGFCSYAVVPGFVLSWQNKKNKDGLPLSEVEPIDDEAAKRAITKTIRETESVGNIDFW
jgi:hypothetical protein